MCCGLLGNGRRRGCGRQIGFKELVKVFASLDGKSLVSSLKTVKFDPVLGSFISEPVDLLFQLLDGVEEILQGLGRDGHKG